MFLIVGANASDFKTVSASDLGNLTIQEEGLTVNNFNFVVEDALMGAIKGTAQCTGKNTSQGDLNYTVYIAEYDKAGSLLVCYSPEPMMNTQEAGTKDKVDHAL